MREDDLSEREDPCLRIAHIAVFSGEQNCESVNRKYDISDVIKKYIQVHESENYYIGYQIRL